MEFNALYSNVALWCLGAVLAVITAMFIIESHSGPEMPESEEEEKEWRETQERWILGLRKFNRIFLAAFVVGCAVIIGRKVYIKGFDLIKVSKSVIVVIAGAWLLDFLFEKFLQYLGKRRFD